MLRPRSFRPPAGFKTMGFTTRALSSQEAHLPLLYTPSSPGLNTPSQTRLNHPSTFPRVNRAQQQMTSTPSRKERKARSLNGRALRRIVARCHVVHIIRHQVVIFPPMRSKGVWQDGGHSSYLLRDWEWRHAGCYVDLSAILLNWIMCRFRHGVRPGWSHHLPWALWGGGAGSCSMSLRACVRYCPCELTALMGAGPRILLVADTELTHRQNGRTVGGLCGREDPAHIFSLQISFDRVFPATASTTSPTPPCTLPVCVSQVWFRDSTMIRLYQYCTVPIRPQNAPSSSVSRLRPSRRPLPA